MIEVDEYRVKEEGKEYPENFWEERFKSWTDEKQFGTSSIGVRRRRGKLDGKGKEEFEGERKGEESLFALRNRKFLTRNCEVRDELTNCMKLTVVFNRVSKGYVLNLDDSNLFNTSFLRVK